MHAVKRNNKMDRVYHDKMNYLFIVKSNLDKVITNWICFSEIFSSHVEPTIVPDIVVAPMISKIGIIEGSTSEKFEECIAT